MTGAQVRAIRRQLGYTQAILADALGCNSDVISRLETGAAPISLKMARKLMHLVGGDVCPTCGQPVSPALPPAPTPR